MLFSSITFLYYFLAIVLALYFVMPKKYRNFVLCFFSLIFYAWGEPKYIVLMLLTITVGYVAGMLMDKLSRKMVMVMSVSICLAFLIYFKYVNFFINNVNVVFHTQLPFLKVIMPIGISFYTFQVISYILDVYWGKAEKQKNFLYLATYISMFPQLIAGPIVRYSDINEQLRDRNYDSSDFAYGIRRFVTGLAKKVLLANQLGELCNIFRASEEKTILFCWMYAAAVMLQIYFDFSAYSDMAIGLGRMLGFHLMENFNYPFMSKSVTEFWRRWHISLGTWFRDYVYIPLGGNRLGVKRQMFHMFIVWMLTGVWHGAEWNFILWGLLFAVLLIIEKLWLYEKLQKSQIWSHIYLLFIVAVSFVIFNAADINEMILDLRNLFLPGDSLPIGCMGREALYYLKSYSIILLISVIGATSLPKDYYYRMKNNVFCSKILIILEPVVIVLLLLLCTAYLIDGSFNPFLYFRF